MQLQPSTAVLHPYGKSPLSLVGEFEARVTKGNKSTLAKFYVVNIQQRPPLLSYYTAYDLGVIHMVQSGTEQVSTVSIPPASITRHYPVEHMSYEEMRHKMTPASEVNKLVDDLMDEAHGDQNIFVKKLVEHYAEPLSGVGKHKYRQIELDIDHSVPGVVQGMRRTALPIREKADKVLDKYESEDIIEDVDGPTDWVSNPVYTPKANPAEVRMNIDMSDANQAIKRRYHVIPTLEELRHDFNGAEIFSVLDMNLGYNQYTLAEGPSRAITTFRTHRGLKRLNFGINTAAEIFQKENEKTFQDIDHLRIIYDDFIVHGTKAEHNRALARTLQRAKDCGLTFSLKKCQFNKPQVPFSKQGMSADPEKVKDLKGAAPPTNSSEAHSFICMAQAVAADFVPNFTQLAAPIRQLTHKGVKFQWSLDCERSFKAIKAAITSDTIMASFHPRLPTKVTVDAAMGIGASATLWQQQNNGVWRPVTHHSRAFTAPEKNYSQLESESLAVFFGVNRNKLYLNGLPHFVVETDHKPLIPLYEKARKTCPARVERHRLNLQGYHFTLRWKPGKAQHQNDPGPICNDFMSRHPAPKAESLPRPSVEEYLNQVVEDGLSNIPTHDSRAAVTLDDFTSATQNDPTMQLLKMAIQRGYIKPSEAVALGPYKQVLTELTLAREGQVVLRGDRIIVPESLQPAVISAAHDGHQGIVRTKQLLRETLWFPQLDKKVERHIESCLPCLATTVMRDREPLRPGEMPDAPWEHVSCDHHGPTHRGEMILVFTDLYSRFPIIRYARRTGHQAAINATDQVLSEFGNICELDTDNGPPFNSHQWKEYLKWMGVKHSPRTPEWPQANRAETCMKGLTAVIQTSEVEGSNYKQELNRFLRAYRATPHPSTGKPPAELMFNGRAFRTRLPGTYSTKRLIHREAVTQRDYITKQRNKERYDAHRHTKPANLQPGDLVLHRQARPRKKIPPYNPQPALITARKGTMVTAQRGNKTITRNSSFFKKLKHPNLILPQAAQMGLRHQRERDTAPSPERHPGAPHPAVPALPRQAAAAVPLQAAPATPQAVLPPPIRRSSRERRSPDRFSSDRFWPSRRMRTGSPLHPFTGPWLSQDDTVAWYL